MGYFIPLKVISYLFYNCMTFLNAICTGRKTNAQYFFMHWREETVADCPLSEIFKDQKTGNQDSKSSLTPIPVQGLTTRLQRTELWLNRRAVQTLPLMGVHISLPGVIILGTLIPQRSQRTNATQPFTTVLAVNALNPNRDLVSLQNYISRNQWKQGKVLKADKDVHMAEREMCQWILSSIHIF